MDTREVSGVDRPASGEPFVVAKSEAGMAGENAGVAAPAASDGEGAPGGAPAPVEAEPGTGGVIVMPAAALQALLAGATGAKTRLEALLAMLQGVKADDAAPVPSEPLMVMADVANMLAATIMPYVMSDGMVGAEDVALAETPAAPVAGAAPAAPATEPAVTKAFLTWTAEYVDSLCDWCFLYVEPSTTHDTDWRTLPLANRHFPIRDHAGRLSLPAVMDAIEAIRSSSAPWLSESKKRSMLLRIADERLCEASIVVRREEIVPPEIVAELASIAELVASVCAAPAPAAPAVAPGAPAPAAAPAAPVTQGMTDFGAVTTKALANLRAIAIAKSEGGGAWDGARVAKMGAACAGLKKAMDDVAAVMGEVAPVAAAAPAAAPAAGAAGDEALKAQVAELGKSLGGVRALITKAEQENTVLRQRVAKMERTTGPSNVVREDRAPEPVAKNHGSPPLHSNLAELARDEQPAAAK